MTQLHQFLSNDQTEENFRPVKTSKDESDILIENSPPARTNDLKKKSYDKMLKNILSTKLISETQSEI